MRLAGWPASGRPRWLSTPLTSSHRFPDGQIFLPLHGHTPGQQPVDPADALGSLLLAAGVSAVQIPPGLEARTVLWRDRLAGKQLLLLLDDAADSEQVRPLLPGSAGSLVLVTSRRHLTALEDAQTVSLDILPARQAGELLVRLATRPGLDPGDPEVAEITRLCGYLPLEHRSGLAAADEAGQQVRGAGAPANPFGVAALGTDRGTAGVQVEVFDVQRQHLAGAGGGLVEHPPQGLFPQRHVTAGQQPVNRWPGHDTGGVDVLTAPFGAGRQDRCGQPAGGVPRQPGGHGAAVAVPGCRAHCPQNCSSSPASSSPLTSASGRLAPSPASSRSSTPV
jgi:hypothetical protein